MDALRHAKIFVNHKCQSHGNKHHRLHAVRGKGYMRSQESASIEYVASAHYCLYSTFFLPWIRSTPTEAVATSTMPVEASPCSTSNGSRVPHNRFVRRLWRWRRPHLYYWKIPIVGLAILGLKFILIGVISPKNYFIFRWECRLIAAQMWNNFGWLRTEILLKIEIKFSWLTLSLKSWRIN